MKLITTRSIGTALVTGVAFWAAEAWAGPGSGPFGPFGSEGAYGGLGPYSSDPYHNTMGLYSENYEVAPSPQRAEPQEKKVVVHRTEPVGERTAEENVSHGKCTTTKHVTHRTRHAGQTTSRAAQGSEQRPASVGERTTSARSRTQTVRNTPTPVGEGTTTSSPSHSVSPAYPNADTDYNNPYR